MNAKHISNIKIAYNDFDPFSLKKEYNIIGVINKNIHNLLDIKIQNESQNSVPKLLRNKKTFLSKSIILLIITY